MAAPAPESTFRRVVAKATAATARMRLVLGVLTLSGVTRDSLTH